MSAGKLSSKIILQKQPITTDDGYGNEHVSGDWAAIAPVLSARIKPIKGQEYKVAEANKQKLSHVITIRKSSLLAELDNNCRAFNPRNNDIFDIHAVLPEERKSYIQLHVTKV